MKKKKELPPIGPIAQKVKLLMDQNLEAPRYDIVTGKTKVAVMIEEMFGRLMRAHGFDAEFEKVLEQCDAS